MSEENVEIVRERYESFKRSDLDAAVESFDDDIVIRTVEGWPEQAHHGKLATRSF